MDNKFKIICPSYNNEKWVETHINSILNQTYKNYDVLYINDNSSDDTLKKVTEIVGDNPKFRIIDNKENMGAAYNYIEYLDGYMEDDEDILVHLDGDDWFADGDVLDKINKEYINNDYWMTYGFYVGWFGGDVLRRASDTPDTQGQCLPHSDFVHNNMLYRQDHWRATHLRTYKWFLFNSVDRKDLISNIDNEYYWKASDLAWAFPCLEMTPPEKIGALDFITYVHNRYPENNARSMERDSAENEKYDIEIRNKKKYKRVTNKKELRGEKMYQVNVIGDYKERHTIPKDFSYVYNQNSGEFDIVVLQDGANIDYIHGRRTFEEDCPVIALLCEPPSLFGMDDIYKQVRENYTKFDRILSWHPDLQDLPNCVYKPIAEISQWNLLPDTELDTSMFQMYPKTKLVSMISSNKTLSEGHNFRMRCVSAVKDKIDMYGRGINEIRCKLDGMKDYKFSVAMENGKFDNYFTEKIIDCFLSGTIPIYYGCDNIGDWFNTDGIISFNTIEELEDIISTLKDSDYEKRLKAVEDNFNRALGEWEDNDRFFNRYLKEMIK